MFIIIPRWFIRIPQGPELMINYNPQCPEASGVKKFPATLPSMNTTVQQPIELDLQHSNSCNLARYGESVRTLLGSVPYLVKRSPG